MAFSLSRQTPIIGTRTQTPLPATASQQRLIGGPTCLQRSKPRSGRRSLQGLQRAVHSPVPGDASRSNAPFAEGILSRLSDDEDSTGKSVGPGNLPDDSSGALISASPGEGPSIPEGRLSWESDSEGSDAAAASSAGRTGNVAPASLQDASSSSSSKRGIGAATVLPAPYAISIMPEGMMSRTGTFSEDEEEEPVLQASTTAVSSKVTNGGVAAAVQGSASGIPEGMLSRVSSDSDPEPQVVADAEPHASCMHAAPSPPPEDSAIPEGMLSRVDSDSDAQADAEPHVGMHASARKLSQDPPQESAVPEGMLSLEDKGTPPPSADGSGGSIFESSLPEGMLSRADSEDEVATQSAAAADTHRPVASHEEETVTSQAEQAVANQACETVVDQVETAGADQEEKAMASHEENRVGLTVELPTVMYRFNSNGTVTQIAANGSSSSHPNRSVSSAALLAHPCLVSMPRSAASAPMQPLTASVLQCGRSFGAMQLTSQVISRQRMRSVMRAAPFKDDSTQQQQQHTIDAITGAAHSGQGNVDTREGSGISMQGTPRASYDSLQDGANNIQPLPAFVTSAIDRHRNALARVQSRLNQLANSNLLDISPPISRTSNATVCEGLLSENSQAGNALTATAFSPADSDSAGHDDELAREITAVRSLLSELRELAANVSDPDGPLSSETSYAAALMANPMHFDTPVDIPTNSQASATGSMQRGTDAFNDSMQPSLEQYTWAQQWYPVATVDGMDRTKPHAVMLLGQKLVLWWDVKGDAWRAFEDRCPHRSAPLSQGSVLADGSLACAYHGWRMDSAGHAVYIPGTRDAAQQAAVRNSPRACAPPYPTATADGLIWVWGETGQGAQERSAMQLPQLPLTDSATQQSVWQSQPWRPVTLPSTSYTHPATSASSRSPAAEAAASRSQLFLPISAEQLLEHAMDAAAYGQGIGDAEQRTKTVGGYLQRHCAALFGSASMPAAAQHVHGGSSIDEAGSPPALQVQQLLPVTPLGGFAFRYARPWLEDVQYTDVQFAPPGLLRVVQQLSGGMQSVVQLAVAPAAPGTCSAFVRQALVKAHGRALSMGTHLSVRLQQVQSAEAVLRLTPQGLSLLQQQSLATQDVAGPAKYFLPTQADKAVLAFRVWWESFAGASIPFADTAAASALASQASLANTLAAQAPDALASELQSLTVRVQALNAIRAAATMLGAAALAAAAVTTAAATAARVLAATGGATAIPAAAESFFTLLTLSQFLPRWTLHAVHWTAGAASYILDGTLHAAAQLLSAAASALMAIVPQTLSQQMASAWGGFRQADPVLTALLAAAPPTSAQVALAVAAAAAAVAWACGRSIAGMRYGAGGCAC